MNWGRKKLVVQNKHKYISGLSPISITSESSSLEQVFTNNKIKMVKSKCESCGKSFSHTGNLKKHIHTIHKGNKDAILVKNLVPLQNI